MRTLILTRGLPGSGKSTAIKKLGLENYTLNPDNFRLMLASPATLPDGTVGINQRVSSDAWQLTFQLLEKRMQRGDLTVIDATHVDTKNFGKYKALAEKYRYRVRLLDFTDVPVEECKRRNQKRDSLKVVPDAVIDRMAARLKETAGVPAFCKPISLDELEWLLKDNVYVLLDQYKRVHILGDLHGCNSCFQKWLHSVGGYSEDDAYIFLGDYLDRGLENVEMLKTIMEFSKKSNVYCLEGNHEIHLWRWANQESTKSDVFNDVTAKELESTGVDKKEVRRFYRSLWQCGLFAFNGNKLICTHGGVTNIPTLLTPTCELIKGAGGYEDSKMCDETFCQNSGEDVYSFHGHRNISEEPVQVNDRAFNLEGQIELGGNLRVVTLTPGKSYGDRLNVSVSEISNEIYRQPHTEVFDKNKRLTSVQNAVEAFRAPLNDNPRACLIKERKFGDISSFNFSRNAFRRGIWNCATIKARGLFINTKTNEIVLRSYDKFFRVDEMPETKLNILKNTLNFPVTAYRKENGFLGLLGWNPETEDLLFSTKGSLDGDFIECFKQIFRDMFKDKSEALSSIREFLKSRYDSGNAVTLVFEVIDPVNDPHIIEYQDPHIVLLDAIHNTLDFATLDYSDLVEFARCAELPVKKRSYVFNTWDEFSDWYAEVIKEDYREEGEPVEGYVLQDTSGFMFKVKSGYYAKWKWIRSIAQSVKTYGRYNSVQKFNGDPEMFDILRFLVQNRYVIPEGDHVDVIHIRKAFESEKS